MPSFQRGVRFFLFVLVTELLLCSSSGTQDAEERQKEEKERESAMVHMIGDAANRAPDPPEDLLVSPQGYDTVMLLWKEPTDATGVDHYYVYVDGEDLKANTKNTYYLFENLEGCTNYTFGVSSVSAEGNMSDPLLGGGDTEVGPPPPPQHLQVDGYTSTTVSLTWDQPDTLCEVPKYKVRWIDDGSIPSSEEVTDTSFTVTNLEENTAYTFDVSAFTSYGEGTAASLEQNTAEHDGGPPENLKAVGVSTSDINVTWSEPTIKPTSYVVTAQPCHLNEELVFELFYTLEDLKPCQTCYISVSSQYEDGYKYKASVKGTTQSGDPPPPQSCSVQVSGNVITVSWERPDTLCSLDEYNVDWTWKNLWGSGDSGSSNEQTSATKLSITELVPYSEYSFEISASINGTFGSPVSCSGTSPETLPGPPVILTADSVQGKALVTWETPAEENGVIVNYEIYVDEEEDPVVEVGGDVHSASVDLNPCVSVGLSVKARNGAGLSLPSDVVDVTVVDDVLPEKVDCTASDSEVEVCWEPYSKTCPVSQYNLEWEGDALWSDDVEDSNNTTLGWTDSQTCYTILALPYTEYYVELTVGSGTDIRSCSDITPMAAPGPPAEVGLATEDLVITVTWTEPEEKNGIIDFYQVEWFNVTGVILGSHTTEDNSTFSYEILESSCGTVVDVTVRAKTVTVEDLGDRSPPQTAYLVNSVSTLNCEPSGPGEVSLSWTLEDADCPVSFYNLTWTYDSLWSNDTGEDWLILGNDATTLKLTSLPPYSSVSLQIYVGNSEEYAECITTTPEEVPGPPVILGVDLVEDEAVVTWETPTEENGIIVNYGIFVDEDDDLLKQVDGDVHNASVKLEMCASIGLSVKARNKAGWGVRSEVHNLTIEDNECFVEAEEHLITVRWQNSSLRDYGVKWTWKKLWGDEEEGSNQINTTDLVYSIDNPVPYSKYTFEVFSLDCSISCSNTSLESPASSPTELVQVAMDINSVTIQWSLPESMRGRLLGWYLNWTSAIGHHLGEQDIMNPEERVLQIGGLAQSEVYNVYVMAVNGAGKGEMAMLETSTEYVP